ncbi:MAG: DUF1572 family protein [Acidobacteria bacterium]|nr:DUF1572 family protein [Acidobacteriota bacterium]
MICKTLIQIYTNDLEKVIAEIGKYKCDEDLWKTSGEITNSAGNLALHLIGNINHFFGANLGKTDYVRERDLEFSDSDRSAEELITKLEATIAVLNSSLGNLSDDDLQKDYPEEFGGQTQTVFAVAAYMLSHLNYHLGQINYHRRLLSQ